MLDLNALELQKQNLILIKNVEDEMD